jgi:3-oxoacyl-[acyl-carrier protein] reductase
MRQALITGAGAPGGIGFACAKGLGAAGCRLAIASTSDRIYLRQAELQALGYEVTAHIADLTDPAQVARLVEEVGPVDVLVNNAGLGSVTAPQPWGNFTDMAAEPWAGSFAATFQPTLLMTRAYLPLMMARGWGRVVQMGSVTGPIVAIAGASAYGAAKAAIVGLTHSLALEVAGSGVTVNIVAPGWVGTEALTGGELAAASASPMNRAGRPEEMAAAVVFLASEGASYVNGATIVVDGGNSLQEKKG